MIWCNKSKAERRRSWITTKPPTHRNAKAAGDWCRAAESTGKFYNHRCSNTRFWFEKEEDAVLFALTWSNK